MIEAMGHQVMTKKKEDISFSF